MMKAGTKNWNETMTVVTRVKKIVGVSIGIVTKRNCSDVAGAVDPGRLVQLSGMC